MARELAVADAFVELADTLVDDFDVIDFLHVLTLRCVELLDVAAAGVLLADARGVLLPAAASDESARLLDLFELQNDEGPCLDCFRSGKPVLNVGIDAAAARWPRFGAEARALGFTSTHAVPLRLRTQVLGALNLFCTGAGALSAADRRLGQALADAATIGVLQQRALAQSELLAAELQTALTSRIIIEQAKGVLAERGQIDIDVAFGQLRGYARAHNLGLTAYARSIVDGSADPGGPGDLGQPKP